MDNPFDITVYDKDFNFTGFVVDPTYLNFVPSWRNQGYGSFMLEADNPHIAAIQEKGARVVVQYRGGHVISGPVRSYRGDLANRKGNSLTFQVLDDYRILGNTLSFVQPTKPLEAQSLDDLGQAWRPNGAPAGSTGDVIGQTSYFLWPDGTPATNNVPAVTSAEEAIKLLIKLNVVDRLGWNVTILPNQGRGGDPTEYLPQTRFEPLDDALTGILNNSGLSVRLWQEKWGDTILCDVFEPDEWEQVLTPESGIVAEGTYAIGAPDITRPIIGGPGQTAARAFSGIEGPATELEEEWGDKIEVFQESSSYDFVWPDGLDQSLQVPKYYPLRATSAEVDKFAKMFADAVKAGLASGPATSTLEVKLSETDTFHYGGTDGIQLGTFITIAASGGTFRNQVTEAQMTFTRDNGLTVTPLIGQLEDDPDVALANALANVARALRKLSTK